MIIIITLVNAWKAHFCSAIDDTSFPWLSAVAPIRKYIDQHIQEDQLHSPF
jgi:hypothetical protein